MGCRKKKAFERLYPAWQAKPERHHRALNRTYHTANCLMRTGPPSGWLKRLPIDGWLVNYNQYRPHESLGGPPLVQFMHRLTLAPTVYPPLTEGAEGRPSRLLCTTQAAPTKGCFAYWLIQIWLDAPKIQPYARQSCPEALQEIQCIFISQLTHDDSRRGSHD